MRARLKALWAMAMADGSFDAQEREAMADILSSLGVTAADLIEAGKNKEPVDMASAFPDETSRTQLLDQLLKISMADGEVDPGEMEQIRLVARTLGVSPTHVDALLEAGQILLSGRSDEDR